MGVGHGGDEKSGVKKAAIKSGSARRSFRRQPRASPLPPAGAALIIIRPDHGGGDAGAGPQSELTCRERRNSVAYQRASHLPPAAYFFLLFYEAGCKCCVTFRCPNDRQACRARGDFARSGCNLPDAVRAGIDADLHRRRP
jgi:hypothetical protein